MLWILAIMAAFVLSSGARLTRASSQDLVQPDDEARRADEGAETKG